MVNYTNRVMIAIQSYMKHEIRWPDSEDRQRSSQFFANLGFPGCIALIDGTLVKLSQWPKEDGMPGRCHDVTCLRRSSLWQKMDTSELFEHNQYMLGDSGYVSHHRLVTAFKNTAGDRDKTDFNTCVAHARVGNEHCIGILKARWHSLRELRTQLRNRKENAYVVRWIRCCVILHNFLTWKKDEWTEADGPVVLEQEVNFQAHIGNERDRNRIGVMRREEVQRYCLDFNRHPGGVLNR
ncbi:hypothetical protein R1sor_001635 [Riccia sorocarpa]|uniref:DDE Tnp4 domain-containing protein n=1 Tax=Riccia sorocarpa TaxID=122646 RepID=A0ABD3GWI1_9MARC